MDIMNDRTNIKSMYYMELTSVAVVLIMSAMVETFLAVQIFGGSEPYFSGDNMLFWIIIVAVVIFSFFSIFRLIKLLKDYNQVKTQNYKKVYGVVVGFKENRDPDSGKQTNNFPIVKTKESGTFTFKVNSFLVVGRSYNFYYLENSKIAEIRGYTNE